MYAIIEDGGKQYRVEPEQELNVELPGLPEDAERMTFEKVLLVADGQQVRVGNPLVAGAKVTAQVVGPAKGPKIDVRTYRRRKHSQRKWGHRQHYLRVRIDQIQVGAPQGET